MMNLNLQQYNPSCGVSHQQVMHRPPSSSTPQAPPLGHIGPKHGECYMFVIDFNIEDIDLLWHHSRP